MDSSLVTAGGLAALCAVFVGVNCIIIPLRFYARYKQGADTFQVDDWTVLCSLLEHHHVAGIAYHLLGYPTPKNPEVLDKALEEFEKLLLVLATFCVLTIGFTKISALFFFRRIFCSRTPSGTFHWATVISIVAQSGWIVAFGVLNFFDCSPIRAMWTPSIKLQSCQRDYAILPGLAISDVIMDCWIVILPIPKIWSIKTSIRRRFAIMGVFLFALVGLGSTIARLVIIEKILSIGQAKNFADVYLTDTETIFLYMLEAGTTLVAVNLPSLWYFHSRVTPENVLRSIRSIVSLASRDSRSVAEEKTVQFTAPRTSNQDSLSSSSRTQLAYAKGGPVEAWALIKGEGGLNGIAVMHSIEQKTEQV
ncbi:hypothetical protein MMC17_005850 [Xylographa soralifera]|nr:hypothetical protein [Xylographa soralifera]